MSTYPARAGSKVGRHQDMEIDGQEGSERLSDSKIVANRMLQERSIAVASNRSTSVPESGIDNQEDTDQSSETQFHKADITPNASPGYPVSPSTISLATVLLTSTTSNDQPVNISHHDCRFKSESKLDTETIINTILHKSPSPTLSPSEASSEIALSDVMAFDAYMKGDYSVLPEYRPKPLRIPLKAVVEEDSEIGMSELEDTSSGRCHDSEDSRSPCLDSDPMGMFNYGYLEPEDWYQSQPSLHKGAQIQNAQISTGVDVKSLAPSIHDMSYYRDKPLPALPPAAHELLSRRNTTASSTKPTSRDAKDFSLHSKYSKIPHDCDMTVKRYPASLRMKTTSSETSSTNSTRQRLRPSIEERNISQELVHPAFRKEALDSSNSVGTKDSLRNVPLVMASYAHRRIMSNSTQSSMVSPSKPPSSPPSSYLHSPPMSPKNPSVAFSDPLPFRSTRDSPLTLLSEFCRSPSRTRVSLEMTGPDSPYIRRNYLPEPRRSRDGLKEYAEAIEAVHGLIRDGDIDDENEDPLVLKKHELLTCGDIPNPSVTKVNLLSSNSRTWPMKKKSSRLRRVGIINPSNQGSLNSSTFSFEPMQQPTEQARPVSSECSVTGEPGDMVDLTSTTSLKSQATDVEKRASYNIEEIYPRRMERKEIYNVKLSEKERSAVMKDLQERRGIRQRLLGAAKGLEKVKLGSKDVSK